MASDSDSTDELNALLYLTFYEGDINPLKAHLSTVKNIDICLNHIYDGPNQQKYTLLTFATLEGYNDIVYMLLNFYKPDLELLNVVQIRDDNEMPEVYRNVTVLWVAAAIDNFPIVKQLVEHGANSNHRTDTNSTPVRCACYNGNVEMVRYLVENGADINITKRNNETNLSLSVFRKHLELTIYLVEELGCDINECDTDGRSPLYFAVKGGSLEIVQFLLSHGAHNFPATSNQMTPLMLAAENRRDDLVDAISSYCSKLEWIEAIELLGSALACAEIGDCDLDQSFQNFFRALELRSTYNLPKKCRNSSNKVFNNRLECQTINQLKEIQLDSDSLHIEALLVRERLLGPTNEKYHYSIIYRGAVLADNGQFSCTITLWLYSLELYRQYSMPIDSEDLRRFPAVFNDMILKSLPIPCEALLITVEIIVNELKHNVKAIDYNLHTMLFLTTIISQPFVNVHLTATDRKLLHRSIYTVNQHRYVANIDRSTLLHLCLNNRTSPSDNLIHRVCKYPCLSTARILLQCGANINATDSAGNTPLHIFVSNNTKCDINTVQFLCDAGAHLDYVNNQRQTPVDIASSTSIQQYLKKKTKINLKCLCARLIQIKGVQFHGIISTSLTSFVERH